MGTPNWANQTIWTGDNLDIMRGMNSESIDLIYLDPPFNSKANYAAPIGSDAAGAAFKDTWTLDDVDIAWLDLIEAKHPKLNRVIQAAMTKSDQSYLIYMAVRVLEMHRLLKPTGSIYLHCDPAMSHYLKLMLDAVFGRRNFFRNEIVWCYKENETATRYFPRKHDTIFLYAKNPTRCVFNVQRGDPTEAQLKRYNHIIDGERYANMKGKMRKLEGGAKLRDWWELPIVQAKERTGYPTQKPLALLEPIIKASSNRGDVVFDPFCGCATALVAADRLDREWVGIDIGKLAVRLVTERIKDDQGLFQDITARTDNPQRNDLGDLPPYNSPKLKNALYGEQGGDCNGCGEHFKKQNLTVDHIIAQSKGGTDHIKNLQLLCGHCNSVKGDRGQEYLLAKLAA